MVTNILHLQELLNAQNDLNRLPEGIDRGISNDLLAMDFPARGRWAACTSSFGRDYPRVAVQATDGLLDKIFSRFCLPELRRALESKTIKIYRPPANATV